MSLCPAVANGDVELVRVLLARGADPNELGSYMGQCAIEWAMHMLKKMTRSKDYDAVRNIFACVELCLDAGALPDGPPTDSKAYEKAHTRALASMLATNFTAHIPEEIFPRVVAFWAHTGFYVSAAAVAALPRAAETNPNQDA